MTPDRFDDLTARYKALHLAVVGDYCLDRYLDIDPRKSETSIETGLAVHNVVAVRAQPGAAGTVLNNLVALGVGSLSAVGFCGDDGEGFELRRALGQLPGVNLEHFITAPDRRTFTYCKPMLCVPGEPPRELQRLDSKNWTPTSAQLSHAISTSLAMLASSVDGMIVMDQVDVAMTGTVTDVVLAQLHRIGTTQPALPIIADSRRGLGTYPPLIFKMNAAELATLQKKTVSAAVEVVKQAAQVLAEKNQRPTFITMAENGMVGAAPGEATVHITALPVRGPIDVVGAGDSVSANVTAALAADATLREAVIMAILASSCVLHQVGTTGTACVAQIKALLPLINA